MDSNDFACACFVLITKVVLLLIKMLWTQFTLGDADGSGDGDGVFFFSSVRLYSLRLLYSTTFKNFPIVSTSLALYFVSSILSESISPLTRPTHYKVDKSAEISMNASENEVRKNVFLRNVKCLRQNVPLTLNRISFTMRIIFFLFEWKVLHPISNVLLVFLQNVLF